MTYMGAEYFIIIINVIEWTPKGKGFSADPTFYQVLPKEEIFVPYPATRSQRDLWNWAHYAAYSTRYKAVATMRLKFSTLILILWNGKTVAKDFSGAL